MCSNPKCGKHTEYMGGKFRYDVAEKKFYCEDCFGIFSVKNEGLNLWDYSTTHFDGHKRYIGSLANMRKLEKEFGVSNQAANYRESNWKNPPADKRAPQLHDGMEKFAGGWQR